MNDHVDNPFQSPATLSICTGIRGLERGVERVTGPLRTLAYVEIEAFIIENLLAGMEAGLVAPAPIWANLKTFPWEFFRGKVGLLMGGYPCQPFSTAGKRGGADDPRHLWPYIEFGIRATRPFSCFFENVSGHLTLGFEQVVHSLRSMGYAVEAGIYTAAEVGAPHKRARVFILAILADAKDHVRGLYERSGRSGKEEGDISGTGETVANANSAARRQGDIAENRIDSGESGLCVERPENSGRFESGGKAMANPNSRDGPGTTGRPEKAGWADSSAGSPDVADGIGSGLEERGEQPTREERQAVERGGNSEQNQLDDSASVRQQGERDDREPLEEANAGSFVPGANHWPAGPGELQYDWEAQRTMGWANRLPRSIRQLWHVLRPHLAKSMGEKVWEETDRNIKAIVEPELGCTIDGYNFREDLLRAFGNGVVEDTAELAFRTLLKKHFA